MIHLLILAGHPQRNNIYFAFMAEEWPDKAWWWSKCFKHVELLTSRKSKFMEIFNSLCCTDQTYFHNTFNSNSCTLTDCFDLNNMHEVYKQNITESFLKNCQILYPKFTMVSFKKCNTIENRWIFCFVNLILQPLICQILPIHNIKTSDCKWFFLTVFVIGGGRGYRSVHYLNSFRYFCSLLPTYVETNSLQQ